MPFTPEQIAARGGKLTAFPARLVGALDDGEPALPRFQAIHHADPIESRPGFAASQGADGRGAGPPKRRYCSRPRPRGIPLPLTRFRVRNRSWRRNAARTSDARDREKGKPWKHQDRMS